MAVIADQSQSAKAYEVLSNLINTAVNANEKLLEISNKRAKLFPKDQPLSMNENPGTTNQNIFVGSTAELANILNTIRENKVSNNETIHISNRLDKE